MSLEALSLASHEGFINCPCETPTSFPRKIGNYNRTLVTLSKNASTSEKVLKWVARSFLSLVFAPLEASLQCRDSLKRIRKYNAEASIAEEFGHFKKAKIWQVMRNERIFAAASQFILALAFLLLTAVGIGALVHFNHDLLVHGAILGGAMVLGGAATFGVGLLYKLSQKKELEEIARYLKSPKLNTSVFSY